MAPLTLFTAEINMFLGLEIIHVLEMKYSSVNADEVIHKPSASQQE